MGTLPYNRGLTRVLLPSLP